MNSEQFNIFKKAFKIANYGKITFPKNLNINKIYDIEIYPNGMRNGIKVRFKIYKISENYVLDLIGGDDYSTWHKRINTNGEIIDLPNYIELNNDSNESKEFNELLYKKLLEQGLEKNFDNEKFENENVITIRNYGF